MINNTANDDRRIDEERDRKFSRVLIALYKGAVYRERDEELWRDLTDLAGPVTDHFSPLSLRLVKDDNEGYAYVAYPLSEEVEDNGDEQMPRLTARRHLSYGVSLLLALLRRRMAEFDTAGDGTRLIVSREEMVELMRPFYPESTNDAKLADKTEISLNKVRELGFVRPLKNRGSQYEVMRILKAFIDAQWLSEFDRRLEGYRKFGAEGKVE